MALYPTLNKLYLLIYLFTYSLTHSLKQSNNQWINQSTNQSSKQALIQKKIFQHSGVSTMAVCPELAYCHVVALDNTEILNTVSDLRALDFVLQGQSRSKM